MLRWLLVCLAMAGASVAMAEPRYGTKRLVVAIDAPRSATSRLATGPRVLFLDRCLGGCSLERGSNSAANKSSSLPLGHGPFNLSAYAWGDVEWQLVVDCMKEVYSPYDVALTDVRPVTGSYAEVIIAGNPGEIGYPEDVLGLANIANNCAALDDTIAFAFANHHPPPDRVNNVCWTAAQEAAHIFGLDHEFQFENADSACTDPMTYRTDCGGRKYFRDRDASCGEYAPRQCHCGGPQNSHRQLLQVFGPGTTTIAPPTSTITSPSSEGMLVDGDVVFAEAGSKRGIGHVDLYLNGSWWLTAPGAPFGSTGQDNPSQYELDVPDRVPDGTIDIVAKAFDDVGVETDSAAITVTKGAPCVTADTCLPEQSCTDGRCVWPQPSGEVGDACTYAQACKSHTCRSLAGSPDDDRETGSDSGPFLCTQTCIPFGIGSSGLCDDGFACTMTNDLSTGICVPAQGGGCCSAGADDRWWAHTAMAGVVMLSMLRRRRARRILLTHDCES